MPLFSKHTCPIHKFFKFVIWTTKDKVEIYVTFRTVLKFSSLLSLLRKQNSHARVARQSSSMNSRFAGSRWKNRQSSGLYSRSGNVLNRSPIYDSCVFGINPESRMRRTLGFKVFLGSARNDQTMYAILIADCVHVAACSYMQLADAHAFSSAARVISCQTSRSHIR